MPGYDITITDKNITFDEISAYQKMPGKVSISRVSQKRIEAAHQVVKNILSSSKAVYGVNTGFGKFSEIRISEDQLAELQKRLVLSHAAGIGQPLSPETVRLIMLLKIKSLSLGHSGCRPEIINQLAKMLNNNIIPYIPEKGSVGASGDLAPLAHMTLVMLGEGQAYIKKNGKYELTDGLTALKSANLSPIQLQAKEGLALLNGTQVISAIGLYTILQTENLLKTADITAAMSLEALLGTLTPFDQRIQKVRGHKGQQLVAENIRRILHKSDIVASHKTSDHRVQDAYSLRCIPQVHGAARDAFDFIKTIFITEVNGVTDNPLVFTEDSEVLSGGNFHGAPVAYAADYLSVILTDLSSMVERRIQHMIDPAVSEMDAFLTGEGGLNSGFMIAHVTAASLVSENKVLAHPASSDSIPTSANKEDHVSMGTYAARKALEISDNLLTILAIELICACQALEFRAPIQPSVTTKAVLQKVRHRIAHWKEDRLIHIDIQTARDSIKSGEILKIAEDKLDYIN